jgi:hypothetical protein
MVSCLGRSILSLSACSALLAFLLSTGCSSGPKAPPLAPVKGTVNLDNKPMDAGDITFSIPGEVPSTLQVNAGAFAGNASIGKAKVEIRSYRPGKKNEMYPDQEPSPENFIPAKWNSESQLTADVTKDGPNEFKFDVTSK